MDDIQKNSVKTDRVVSKLRSDFRIVGSHRVHGWYAWAIIGVVFGLAAGITYVANQSGQFAASQAAQVVPKAALPTGRSLGVGYDTFAVMSFESTADKSTDWAKAWFPERHEEEDDDSFVDTIGNIVTGFVKGAIKGGPAFLVTGARGAIVDANNSTGDSEVYYTYRTFSGPAVALKQPPKGELIDPVPGAQMVSYRAGTAIKKTAPTGMTRYFLTDKVTIPEGAAILSSALTFNSYEDNIDVLVRTKKGNKFSKSVKVLNTSGVNLRKPITINLTGLQNGENQVGLYGEQNSLKVRRPAGASWQGHVLLGFSSSAATELETGMNKELLTVPVLGTGEQMNLSRFNIVLETMGATPMNQQDLSALATKIVIKNTRTGETLVDKGRVCRQTGADTRSVTCQIGTTLAPLNYVFTGARGEVVTFGFFADVEKVTNLRLRTVSSAETLTAVASKRSFVFPTFTGKEVVFKKANPTNEPPVTPGVFINAASAGQLNKARNSSDSLGQVVVTNNFEYPITLTKIKALLHGSALKTGTSTPPIAFTVNLIDVATGQAFGTGTPQECVSTLVASDGCTVEFLPAYTVSAQTTKTLRVVVNSNDFTNRPNESEQLVFLVMGEQDLDWVAGEAAGKGMGAVQILNEYE